MPLDLPTEGLPDQQEHIEYLELRKVWKSIGLSMEEEALQYWRTEYPVNIAVLDSGVNANHQAFNSSNLDPQPTCKVIESYVRVDGKWLAENHDENHDASGHGTFCAGVATGYYIPSPNKDDKNEECAPEFCNLPEFKPLSDESKKKIEDIFQRLSGGASESLPFVGVAPFANIISYKVDDDKNNLEEALAAALQDIAECNNSVEFKDQVHIVSISLSAHYHDGVRQALYDVLNSDVIIVAAACNMGQINNYCSGNIWFPARFGNVISVGSHDNLGQPSKISSVGREVDFLAPGEEIWGPSISKENGSIEKDEGTSVSAAIVSGIVALVLAFVHKEKGLGARTKISNNPVMKKILRNMATRRERHDEIMGYGNLKPLVVFGHGAHVLWDHCDSKPTESSSDEICTGTTTVNKFVLEDQINLNTGDILHGLQFTNQVKVINLVVKNPTLLLNGQLPSVLEKVSEAINSSNVEVVERIVFSVHPSLYRVDLVIQFLKKLPETVLAHLSRLDIFLSFSKGISWEDLSKIAKIIGDAKQTEASTSILIFVQNIVRSTECDIPACDKVKISIGIDEVSTSDGDEKYITDVIMKRKFTNVITCSFDCTDCFHGEFIGISGSQVKKDHRYVPATDAILHGKSYKTYADNCASEVYPCLSSLSNSVSSDEKITVAILGESNYFPFTYIRGGKLSQLPFKSFTPSIYMTRMHNVRTFCNFIIAGESNGIAPFVNLVGASVITDEFRAEWVVPALKWIEEEHKEVDIVVIPFGFNEFDSNIYKAINNLSKGKIVICAASGSHNSFRPVISYPACYGDVISVGSHSSMFQPSLFSPQGREIDVLALGEYVTIKNHLKYVYPLEDYRFWENHALSGTCVAVACAAGVVAQILARGVQCGFTREQIANNTVARELLRQLTRNLSHNPQTGYGCLPDVSESLLFRSDDYFKEIVNGILRRNLPGENE